VRRLLATTFYPAIFSDRADPTSYEQYMVEMINRARATARRARPSAAETIFSSL